MLKPTYYECGCCECLHNVRFTGDCRQDDARFSAEQLDAKHGRFGWDEIPQEDLEDIERPYPAGLFPDLLDEYGGTVNT